MSKYRWEIVFEAEDDAEAKDVIYNDLHGAIQSFETIDRDKLTEAETGVEVP